MYKCIKKEWHTGTYKFLKEHDYIIKGRKAYNL